MADVAALADERALLSALSVVTVVVVVAVVAVVSENDLFMIFSPTTKSETTTPSLLIFRPQPQTL